MPAQTISSGFKPSPSGEKSISKITSGLSYSTSSTQCINVSSMSNRATFFWLTGSHGSGKYTRPPKASESSYIDGGYENADLICSKLSNVV